MSKSSRAVKNAMVSKHFRLSADDAASISNLTVRPGKVTATGRKKTTSGVWNYFGLLYQVKSKSSTGYILISYVIQYLMLKFNVNDHKKQHKRYV